jgi:hypothetical protein
VPNTREGYTTDDNARALIVSILLDEILNNLDGRENTLDLSHRYLSFLWLAFQYRYPEDSETFFGYDRKWLEDVGSDDSHGRALWSLGKVLGIRKNAGLRGAAGRLFEAAVPATLKFYQSARLGVFHPGHASLSGLVSRRQSHPRSSQRRLRIGSSISMRKLIPRRGDGLRRVFPTRMPDCRKRSFWQDGGATTRE